MSEKRESVPDREPEENSGITLTVDLDSAGEDLDLLTSIGYALEYGTVFQQDYAAAFRMYKAAARAGSGVAWNNLGFMYEAGHGVPKNSAKAEQLFLKGAELGEPVAMVNLGNLYEYGELEEGVNYDKAGYWYREAAARGNRTGMFNYANMLHFGHGSETDYKQAFELFSRLYEENYPHSAFYLGLYYENGFAVEQDYEKARYYYRMGALQGDAYCYNQLGSLYGRGAGVEKDAKAAMDYYRKAAELGDDLAPANIGYFYETGEGVEKDLNEAVRWYRRGAGLGDQHAVEALNRLADESIEAGQEEKRDSRPEAEKETRESEGASMEAGSSPRSEAVKGKGQKRYDPGFEGIRCPVCGKSVLYGDGDVCPECSWFYDAVQQDDPDEEDGENHMSLNQAREAYARGEEVW